MKVFRLKFIIILFLAMLAISLFAPFKAYADDIDMQYINPTQFDNSSYNTLSDAQITKNGQTVGGFIKKFLGVLLTILRIATLGWAIIMLISIAIKYMTSAPQIKAQLKTDIPTYIIGAVLLFGASGILTVIQYFTEDTFKT